LVSVFVITGASTRYEVKLEVKACRTATPALLATLGREWQVLSAYAQGCPVLAQDGKIALTVAIVRIDLMQKQRWFNAHSDPHIPLPVMLDSQSQVVGRLAEGFPADLPGALRVTFKDWHSDTPTRIDQYEAFETALPPHTLATQVWNAGAHHFQPVTEKP